MKQFGLSLLVALAVAGCATLEDHEVALQLLTRQLVMRVIVQSEDPAHYALRVEQIADDTLAFMSGEPTATVSVIADAVHGLIHWETLSPVDKALASDLLTLLQAEISKRVGTGALDPAKVEDVKMIVGWIKDAAKDSGNYL